MASDFGNIMKFVAPALGVVMAISMLASVAQSMGPQYQCPICGAKFNTFAELEEHFISAHPTEPIEIIWS